VSTRGVDDYRVDPGSIRVALPFFPATGLRSTYVRPWLHGGFGLGKGGSVVGGSLSDRLRRAGRKLYRRVLLEAWYSPRNLAICAPAVFHITRHLLDELRPDPSAGRLRLPAADRIYDGGAPGGS
jgi:hypothetical protein